MRLDRFDLGTIEEMASRGERLKALAESPLWNDIEAVALAVGSAYLDRAMQGDHGACIGLAAIRDFLNSVGDNIALGDAMREELVRRLVGGNGHAAKAKA